MDSYLWIVVLDRITSEDSFTGIAVSRAIFKDYEKAKRYLMRIVKNFERDGFECEFFDDWHVYCRKVEGWREEKGIDGTILMVPKKVRRFFIKLELSKVLIESPGI